MVNPFKKFTKKDLVFSLATGLITGLIVWRIFIFLNLSEIVYRQIYCIMAPCVSPYTISWAWIVLIVPILWVLGVNFGYFLGQWIGFFNQFGKFVAVGFTNAAVYFGILNTLIAQTDINKGIWYSVFVAIAFVIAATQSYFWNKFWVFRSSGDSLSLSESGAEFSKFIGVSVSAGLVNIGIASFVVNFLDPSFGLTADQWANFGGIAGSAVALVFSFTGFKLTVFKK